MLVRTSTEDSSKKMYLSPGVLLLAQQEVISRQLQTPLPQLHSEDCDSTTESEPCHLLQLDIKDILKLFCTFPIIKLIIKDITASTSGGN